MQKVVSYQILVSKVREILKDNHLLYLPSKDLHYRKITDVEKVDEFPLDTIRMIEPIKVFFFKPKEDIINFEQKDFMQVIIGVKSCDLSALNILDKMFISEDYVDPLYKFFRERTILISSDCPFPKESCFCNLVGEKPYAEKGFDLNLEYVNGERYILSSGSKKGEEILNRFFSEFDSPTKEDIIMQADSRARSQEILIKNNNDCMLDEKKYYSIVKESYDINEIWQQESKNCVQCEGCNFICPSCYCFFIRENSVSEEEVRRDRVWDACHSTGYGRVAGGANPRRYKFQRFRNRYQCKFVYRQENFGFYGCTGCGRCVEVCPGKIDIRKVVKNLSEIKI